MASTDAGVNPMSSANPTPGSGNAGVGGIDAPTTELPYLGSKICLLSNAEIRYEGTLHSINPAESTVSLRFVKSFGTEGRKEPYIAPSNETYEHVVFRGLDIKDLTVCSEPETTPPQVFPADPAIVSVSGPTEAGLSPHINYDGTNQKIQSRREGNAAGPLIPTEGDAQGGMWGGVMGRSAWMNMGPNRPMPTTTPMPPPMADYKSHSMKDMGYHYQGHAMGNSQKFHSRGRRGLHGMGGYNNYSPNLYHHSGGGKYHNRQVVGELPSKPNEQLRNEMARDFDFQSMNSKFQKPKQQDIDVAKTVLPSSNSRPPDPQNAKGDFKVGSYNRNTSFFDSISCEALDRQQGREEKVDRNAQRQLDVVTFGAFAASYRPMAGGGKRGGRGRGRGGRGRMGGYHHGNLYNAHYIPRNSPAQH